MERQLDESIAPEESPAVPRWARLAAYAVPLCVLPSALWRVGHVLNWALFGPGPCDTGGLSQAWYMVFLSVASLGAAYLTVGLVRPWGERFPAWIPRLGGREVPARAATAAAMVGAAVLALITAYAFTKDTLGLGFEGGTLPPGCQPPGLGVGLLYLPLPAWAPLLFIVALHYKRRRGVSRINHQSERKGRHAMTDITTLDAQPGSATAGHLKVRRGLENATLWAGGGMGDLFHARWERCAPDVEVRAERVTLTFPVLCLRGRDRTNDIILNAGLPWLIQVEGAAKDLAVDLSAMTLLAFDVSGGVSGLELDLGRPTGTVRVRLGPVHNVIIRRPVSAPVRVQVARGASELSLDDRRFGALGGPSSWQSPDFEAATDRYDISVAGGARELTVVPMRNTTF